MGSKSKIQWTDATWNPVTGCSKISEGCANCYAHTYAKRFHGGDFSVKLYPEKLDIPLRWRKPRKIFVNSMSDLFHEDVPFEYIDKVFHEMAHIQRHMYQILTKRPERMLEWFNRIKIVIDDGEFLRRTGESGITIGFDDWPLSNVWLGVTAENQEMANERIPILLQTPAAKRFVSIEPMLEQIDISPYLTTEMIDWVIVGGETGPHARHIHPDWVRSIRDQCESADVPFMFKSWGEWTPTGKTEPGSPWCEKVGKKRSGHLLDGMDHMEFPA